MPKEKIICFGEIYWEPVAGHAQLMGFPINFAYHARKSGLQAELVVSIGEDLPGRKAVNIIDRYGFSTQYLLIDFENKTTRLDRSLHDEYLVLENISNPAPWDNLEFNEDLQNLLSSSGYIAFTNSILRGGKSWDCWQKIRAFPVKKVLDFRYPPLPFHKARIEEIFTGLTHLSIHYSELEFLTGWLSDNPSSTARLDLLSTRFRIPSVLLIMPDGSVIWKFRGQILFSSGRVKQDLLRSDGRDALTAMIVKGIHDEKNPILVFDRAFRLLDFMEKQESIRPDYDPDRL